MSRKFDKLNKMMQPEDNLWTADIVFLVIPLLMLSSLAYGMVDTHESTYRYTGSGFVDGSFGLIDTVLGLAMLLFVLALLTTSITRLLYRIQHRKRA